MDKAQLNKAYFETGDWLHTEYKGLPIFKYTTDLWRYREIILETEPDLIIETGSLYGASAIWFRTQDVETKVISIDINEVDIEYDGVEFVTDNSLNINIEVDAYERVMVVLDSDHSKDHVLAELKKFAPLVTRGCYLVVEDTFISQYLNNKDPNNNYSGGSSWEAIQEWNSTGFETQPDTFALSMNPGGWFKKL